MIVGLTALMSSTSMPNFCRCPGRKLVRNTSARRASSSSTCLPSGTDMSSPMLRLRRLACSMFGLGSPSTISGPVCRSPRCGSPVTACSTLMTSAPHSASTAPADGTNPYIATSRTRIPSSGLVIGRYFLLFAQAAHRPLSLDHRCERLLFQELLQPCRSHLPPDAALLVSAERCVGAEVVAAVDAEGAGPDPAGHRERPVLAAEHGAGQPIDRIVGDPHRIVVVVVTDDHENRPEDFLLGDLAIRVDVGQQRRRIEVAGV